MATEIDQLTELTTTSDNDLLLLREASTGVDKRMRAQNLRAKATTKGDVGLSNVDNVSAANLRDRSTHTGTQPLSTISDAGTAAAEDVGAFATSAQGDLADTALQDGDTVSFLDIDGGTIDDTVIGGISAAAGSFTDVDVSGTISDSGGTSVQWNTAFSWGDHAAVGYLTAETDTLASVTARGDSTGEALLLNGSVTFGAEIVESVHTLTGTTPSLDPANGTIQTWTLTANSTPTDSLATGESLTLLIDDAAGFTITWPTMEWVGGSAPTLGQDNTTHIELWKVGTVLYGALLGVSS